jgi:hypothetical protein
MKSADEIIDFIADRIGHIYHHRPLMYGDTPAGVDHILDYYHELWAEIVDRQQDYRDAFERAHREEDCDAMTFSRRYANRHPNATDEEIANYTVKRWRNISDQLGVPIPHDNIIRDLERTFGRDHS